MTFVEFLDKHFQQIGNGILALAFFAVFAYGVKKLFEP